MSSKVMYRCPSCKKQLRSLRTDLTVCPLCGVDGLVPIAIGPAQPEEVIQKQPVPVPERRPIEDVIVDKMTDIEAAVLDGFMSGFENGYGKGYDKGFQNGYELAMSEIARLNSPDEDEFEEVGEA